jgi:hypothetical protein
MYYHARRQASVSPERDEENRELTPSEATVNNREIPSARLAGSFVTSYRRQHAVPCLPSDAAPRRQGR